MTARRDLPRPYRPSNGTEGMIFDDRWCSNCARDAAWREDDSKEPCGILSRTFLYEIDDPDYPTEWIEDDAGPRCTAFSTIGADPELEAAQADPRQMALPI